MWIVFIGPPGAGKGTQCKRLAERWSIPHLSTGDLLREVQGRDSALARWVAKYLDAGELVPDHLAMRIVAKRLSLPDCGSGCLLDGFPRTMVQTELLDNYLARAGRKLDLVLELSVPSEVLMERLRHRGNTENRSDDSLETIKQRLKVFERETAPLLGYYRSKGALVTVDGLGSADKVFDRITQVVTCHLAGGEK